MRRSVISLAALAWTGAAYGNDRPAIAPPPAWVKPLPLPADDGKVDSAAFRLLLNDQQMNFARDGITRYAEIVMKVQTPQGLAVGNVNLPWDPTLDTLTVHKLHILRAGKTIDVLVTQSFAVLRRETNLERAMLDGRLTASLQPEGLQVGDVIDLALSVKHLDPALSGHVEGLLGLGADTPVGLARMTARWPAAVPLRWRATPGLPTLTPAAADGDRGIGFAPQPIAPVALPNGAPPRYAIVRQAEFTDLPDWAAAGALLAPLFANAAVLPPGGALAAEATRIAAAHPDPKGRAQAALTLVQEQVRYLAVGINDGGLVPVPAETNWARRYGDCKGKTVMLVGLLHALGIEAVPVLVSSTAGDGLDQRLPMIGLFDHVLVRATIAGRTYWLDGTRPGDRDIDAIETPPFRWGLPLLPAGAALVPIIPAAPTRPYVKTSVRLDTRAGLAKPAPAHVESRFRGDGATAMRLALANLTPDQLDRGLREYWRGEYPSIEPTAVSAQYDDATGEELLTLDGTATMDWTGGGYETDGTSIGYAADFHRDPGIDREAPFVVAFPTYSRTTETILLPDHGKGFTLDDARLDRTIAGIEYHRSGTLSDGTVTLERTIRSVAPEFPASEAAAAQAELTRLGRRAIYVRPPQNAMPAATTAAATDSWDYEKIKAEIGAGHAAEAIKTLDRIIAADPEQAIPYALRAHAKEAAGRAAEARADFDRAVALAPQDVLFLCARGYSALVAGDVDQALIDASTAIGIAPNQGIGYALRAKAFAARGASEKAAADAEQAIVHQPDNPDNYLTLANALRAQGKTEESLAVGKSLVTANPRNDYAHVVAGAIYGRYHRDADAQREFDAAIAIKPSAYIYLTRLEYRQRGDLAGRQQDIDAARKLEPANPAVTVQQAKLHDRTGRYAAAIPLWTAVIERSPADRGPRIARGIDYLRTGQTVRGEADLAPADGEKPTSASLNGVCWAKATANVVLESALADCDAALRLAPDNAAAVDSRGFVLLRLRRYADSVSAYDRALELRPRLAESLYGRSLARLAIGDHAGAASDRAAALAVNPDVVDEYAGYGLPAPAP